jgi:excisionase family DNA binding protein
MTRIKIADWEFTVDTLIYGGAETESGYGVAVYICDGDLIIDDGDKSERYEDTPENRIKLINEAKQYELELEVGINPYLTVNQFARKHSVTERTVRAWIAQEKIQAQKFGRDWMIPADTPKPADRRYVENPIRNRRKNIAEKEKGE